MSIITLNKYYRLEFQSYSVVTDDSDSDGEAEEIETSADVIERSVTRVTSRSLPG